MIEIGIFDFFKRKSGTGNQEGGRYRYHSPFYICGDWNLSNSEIIYAAVSRLANALGSMPIGLFENHKRLGDQLDDLISNAPNPNMTSFEFFRTMEAIRNTQGNTYALKVPNEMMQIERLDIQDPYKVEPVIEDETKELWYRVQLDNGEAYVHNYNMLAPETYQRKRHKRFESDFYFK